MSLENSVEEIYDSDAAKGSKFKSFLKKTATGLMLLPFVFGATAFADDKVNTPSQASTTTVEETQQATETPWYLKVLDEINFKVDDPLISALQGKMNVNQSYSIDFRLPRAGAPLQIDSSFYIEVPITHITENLSEEEVRNILKTGSEFKEEDIPKIVSRLNRSHYFKLKTGFLRSKKNVSAEVYIDNPGKDLPVALYLKYSDLEDSFFDSLRNLNFLSSFDKYNLRQVAPGVPHYTSSVYETLSKDALSENLELIYNFLDVFHNDLNVLYEQVKDLPNSDGFEQLIENPYEFFKSQYDSAILNLDKTLRFIYSLSDEQSTHSADLRFSVDLWKPRDSDIKQYLLNVSLIVSGKGVNLRDNKFTLTNAWESIYLSNYKIFQSPEEHLFFLGYVIGDENSREFYSFVDMNKDGFFDNKDFIARIKNPSQIYRLVDDEMYRKSLAISWDDPNFKNFVAKNSEYKSIDDFLNRLNDFLAENFYKEK